MSEETKKQLLRNFDFAAKIAAFIGPFALGAALLWLNANFVSRAEFEKMSERLSKVETAIVLLIEQQKSVDREARRIDDHEQRIRALESKN